MRSNQERKLGNWIGGFLEYTAGMPTSPIFRRWSGIAAVSAALTRRVWTQTDVSKAYPNLIAMLVGAPSTGKGFAIKAALRLLETIDYSYHETPAMQMTGIRLGTDSTSSAGLFDEYLDDKSARILEWDGKRIGFRSVVVVAEEAASLFANADLNLMARLIKLVDCNDRVSERLRKQGEQMHIDKPVLAMLAGIQPVTMHTLFPEAAWGQGFLARTNFVYSEEPKVVKPFGGVGGLDEKLFAQLAHDLNCITNMSGPFLYREKAATFINDWWVEQASKDRPTHPRLENYSSKRIEHIMRLSMVNSAARSDEMVVELADVEFALQIMLDTEHRIAGMFDNTVGIQSDIAAMQEVAHQISLLFSTTGEPVAHHTVMVLLCKRVSAAAAPAVLDQMKAQHMVQEVRPVKKLPGPNNARAYIPFLGVKTEAPSKGN